MLFKTGKILKPTRKIKILIHLFFPLFFTLIVTSYYIFLENDRNEHYYFLDYLYGLFIVYFSLSLPHYVALLTSFHKKVKPTLLYLLSMANIYFILYFIFMYILNYLEFPLLALYLLLAFYLTWGIVYNKIKNNVKPTLLYLLNMVNIVFIVLFIFMYVLKYFDYSLGQFYLSGAFFFLFLTWVIVHNKIKKIGEL